MAKKYTLLAEKRDRAGKGVARALRLQHKVPAVIYGDKKEPVLIALPEKEVVKEYMHGYMFTHLCELDISGKKELCLARDVQTHPVTDRIEHIDFLRVSPKTKINVQVPVHFTNQDKSAALKAGGVLNVVRHEAELECSATDIPEYIEVDISEFKFGDSIRISHAALPAGTASAIDRDVVLATMVASRAAASADSTEEAATAAAPAADKKDEAKK